MLLGLLDGLGLRLHILRLVIGASGVVHPHEFRLGPRDRHVFDVLLLGIILLAARIERVPEDENAMRLKALGLVDTG